MSCSLLEALFLSDFGEGFQLLPVHVVLPVNFLSAASKFSEFRSSTLKHSENRGIALERNHMPVFRSDSAKRVSRVQHPIVDEVGHVDLAGQSPESNTAEQSVAMLTAVIEGETYESVAATFGLSRTAVHKRVKRITDRLVRQIGIEGSGNRAFHSTKRLRDQRIAVADALQKFDPHQNETSLAASVIAEADMVRAVNRIRARSVHWRRDTAMFLLLFATGARPLEIARLQVRDYVDPQGATRRVSELREESSVSGRSRPLYFASQRLIEAMDEYLRERVALSWGVGDPASYRGLAPRSGLFLTGKGEVFQVTAHANGKQRQFLCRAIQETYRAIFRNAELPGATALSVRATLAARLYDRGADEEQVGQVLGITDRRALRKMFPRRRPSISELVEELI
jgi:integrase